MRIRRENYEEFFLDYLEGNLEEKLVDEFIEFLQQNPDLKKELRSFEFYTADAVDKIFPDKERLHKEKFDSTTKFNFASVGILENDLTEEEKEEFVQYLEKHPEKQKEFELFQNTILFPDESVVFRKKSKLLKLTTGQKIWSYTIRIAAVLVLVFSFSILLKQHSEIDVPPSQIVKVATITPEIETTQKPQKEVKKDPKKIPSKPVVKDTIKVESTKSIRENNKGRIEGEDFIAFHRDSIVDKYLIAKVANISVNEPIIALMEVDQFILPDYFNEISEREVLLAERIKRKTGLDKFRLNDITKAGLKLFANISKNKFTYDTNEEGNITELNFETRLLAFSIPTKGNPE